MNYHGFDSKGTFQGWYYNRNVLQLRGQIEIEKECHFLENGYNWRFPCQAKYTRLKKKERKYKYHMLLFMDPKLYKETCNHVCIYSMKVDIKRDRKVGA